MQISEAEIICDALDSPWPVRELAKMVYFVVVSTSHPNLHFLVKLCAREDVSKIRLARQDVPFFCEWYLRLERPSQISTQNSWSLEDPRHSLRIPNMTHFFGSSQKLNLTQPDLGGNGFPANLAAPTGGVVVGGWQHLFQGSLGIVQDTFLCLLFVESGDGRCYVEGICNPLEICLKEFIGSSFMFPILHLHFCAGGARNFRSLAVGRSYFGNPWTSLGQHWGSCELRMRWRLGELHHASGRWPKGRKKKLIFGRKSSQRTQKLPSLFRG